VTKRDRRGTQGLHAALATPARARLLDLLRAHGGALDARELAEMCGLHVNTTRFHLDVLADAGVVTRERRMSGRRGRPRLLYRAAAEPAPGIGSGSGYALLAGTLASHWNGDDGGSDGSRRAERAGYAAAAAMIGQPPPGTSTAESDDHPEEADFKARLAPVVALFAELGFEPDLVHDGSAAQLRLHACPFRAVAVTHPEVVCSVHLGLLRGALEELGVPASVHELHPFAEPQLCTATLAPVPNRTATALVSPRADGAVQRSVRQ
jgi:predicted ArsR family transcriptional regulator